MDKDQNNQSTAEEGSNIPIIKSPGDTEEVLQQSNEDRHEAEEINQNAEGKELNDEAFSPTPAALNPQPLDTMEVHKHPHHVTHKKNWGEYLLEFFMLFLAVFLGFVAENIREHQVENERANVLARNLYKEIYHDSVEIEQKLNIRKTKEEQCSYFVSYIRDSSLTNLSSKFYPAFTWAFIQTAQLLFDPNDGILNQLKNSGELRYFKSNKLQAAIGNLSVAIANTRSRNEKEYSFVEFYLRPFSIKHFDFTWYEALTQHGKLTLLDALIHNTAPGGKIVNPESFSRQEAENIASYYLLMLRSTRQQVYYKYLSANHQLLQILREEYHVENE